MEQNIFLQEYCKLFSIYIYTAKKYIRYFCGSTQINSWKSNMLEENIENITKSDSNFAPTFVNYLVLPDINFNGHCLMKN